MLPTSQRTAALSLRVLVLGVLASIATTGCDIVTADLRHAATSEWRKSYTLEPGGRLEVSNVNGRIQVEASEGNQVEIVAQKKARGISEDAAKEAADRVEIKETVSSSSIRIETKMPQTSGMFRGSAEVSYSVRVPSGADVKLTTVNGGIELSRLTGKIDVETTNGGIVAPRGGRSHRGVDDERRSRSRADAGGQRRRQARVRQRRNQASAAVRGCGDNLGQRGKWWHRRRRADA